MAPKLMVRSTCGPECRGECVVARPESMRRGGYRLLNCEPPPRATAPPSSIPQPGEPSMNLLHAEVLGWFEGIVEWIKRLPWIR